MLPITIRTPPRAALRHDTKRFYPRVIVSDSTLYPPGLGPVIRQCVIYHSPLRQSLDS
jgi:hypothetical protein